MPSNTSPEDNGVKGSNDDATAGTGNAVGGQPGTTPDRSDAQPGRSDVQGGTDETPHDPDGQGNDWGAYENVNQDDEADRLRGTPDDRPLAARQESADEVGTARPSKN